ncbi:MAG: Ig family protein [Bacteroidetes bacterium]|jgi:hypothetical protein|nr:Ig family protein [Bacteroidota bacterium]
MKRKITLLFAAAVCAFQMNSQVTLTEDFNAPFTPNGTAWATQNNSAPTGTLSWFQGNPANFPAYNGATNSYYSVAYVSTSGAGNISNWLVTPTVNIYNGAVLSFATRAPGTATVYPDRLQVRYSTSSATTIPTGSASVGGFTNLMLDINPLYSTSTASAVNNGTVNGYPGVWTVYQLTVTGQATPVVGRFAFRYFVENGGPAGANSDLIGIDAVKYEEPCGASAPSYSNCAGNTTTIQAVGGLGQTTYSWNTGATTSSLTVSPASTTVYTLTTFYPGGTCTNVVTSTVNVGTTLGINVTASSPTICSGNTATLTASSSAATYTWLPGLQSTASITVSPSAAQVYTVAGQNGACFGAATVAIGVNASPTVAASSSSLNVCVNQSFTLTGTGAATYTWAIGAQGFTANPISLSSSVAAVYNFTLTGASANGCKMSVPLSQTISACTGIEANNVNGYNVTVFPNPFANEVTVSGVTGNVQIFNTLGQMVISTPIRETETINTTSLAKGVYIVKTFDSEGREVKTIRMIKN